LTKLFTVQLTKENSRKKYVVIRKIGKLGEIYGSVGWARFLNLVGFYQF
jgi:uncharacterized protein Veg